jgi:hypothetical protein
MPPSQLIAAALLFVLARIASAEDAPAPAAPNSPGATTAPAAPNGPVELPSWMSGDVVKAAVTINMTDAQKRNFNETVSDFVSDHFAMIQKEAKREAPDLEQRVRSRDSSLARQMDDRMHKILTTDQWSAYQNYRKVLQKELKNAPLPQQSDHTRAQPGVGGGRG